MSMQMPADSSGALLPGVSIVGYRETTQANMAGRVVQGQAITISIPTGATATVFIPSDQLKQTAIVAAALNQRAQELIDIANLAK